MNVRPCDVLDDYLLSDLTERDAASFRSHLDACDHCRHELAVQSRLDALLASDHARAAPDALRTLVAAAATRNDRRRTLRRVVTVLSATAAVAAAIVIAMWPGLWARRAAEDQALTEPALEMPREQFAAAEPSHSQPVAIFESDDMIALPVPSDSPEVTIVRLYPTTAAVRRKRLGATLYNLFDSNGG